MFRKETIVKLKSTSTMNDAMGPFLRGKIRRVLNKTGTFCINGTRHARINGTVRVLFLIFPRINGPNELNEFSRSNCTHTMVLRTL